MKKLLLCLLILPLISGTNKIEKNMQADTTKPKSFKLAMIQMEVKGGDQAGNLLHATARIEEAARHGARLALLPEVLDFGWCHSSAREHAGTIPGGLSFETLSRAASDNRIYVCAGLAERDHDKLYNSAVIIDPQGKLLIRHRKLNELDFAHDLYNQGDRLNVAETDLGTIGLLICADANADGLTLSKSLCYMGADLIISPCAWAVPPDYNNRTNPYGDTWRNAYGPISRMFDVWFVGVSNVGKVEDGEWEGWDCIGCSLAYAPGGKEIVQAPYGATADTVIYIDIEPVERPARGTKWGEYIHKHD